LLTLISTMVSLRPWVDRHHVGAAAVGQRHFADGEQVAAAEQPGHPARDLAATAEHRRSRRGIEGSGAVETSLRTKERDRR
jgi:hypothetical protein